MSVSANSVRGRKKNDQKRTCLRNYCVPQDDAAEIWTKIKDKMMNELVVYSNILLSCNVE